MSAAAPLDRLAEIGEALIRRRLKDALHQAGAALQDYREMAPHDALAASMAEALRQFLTRGISAEEWQRQELAERRLRGLSPVDLDHLIAVAKEAGPGGGPSGLPENVVVLRPRGRP